MKRILTLKYLLLLFICISCGQKSSKKQNDIKSDKIEQTRESLNKKSEIDIEKIDEIKKESSTIKNYICYTSDNNNSKKIWIGFNDSNRAIEIRYKGQSESIPLKFIKNEYIEGGTSPTIIDYYNEIYNGKINGVYKLTKSGNWYYVSYKREKDDKEFNFTIDHTVENLSSTPCF
ncbi:hypothetical protein MK851_15545 [Tenacibaculum sp. 1B UA]|uniref:hypothetical protein n=1 Tax=unclassified Tenacibaculum TaxID=2635139 RepID=UPI0026E3B603|nr:MULTISPECIES: hypothetical protein [unclassified Tenacibaculum]MDO6676917.1 hypothetical protein [Tenacibaculum sp. 1_MG-2023]MDX8555022.1 hypothetical protein [Tenacibaculum sp. 1B UA]